MKNLLLGVAVLILVGILYVFFSPRQFNLPVPQTKPLATPVSSPGIVPVNFKKGVTNYVIPQTKQVFQTFNNCGPAALSMALSYNGVNASQQELGQRLRPYQNPQGDNDDKSVFFPEMSQAAEEYGMVTYMRPNGSMELLKTFVANDIPVVVRTWLHKGEDIGHYRLVRGFDEKTILQDDSFEGGNLRFSYADFNELWAPFSYDYLIIVPKEKKALVEAILAAELDEKVAWQNALTRAQKENNLFNQSVAHFYLGDYQKSVEAFEKVQASLPFRMLWYQTEPIQSYLALGNYDKVFAMTDQILRNNNLAYSELYVIRGKAYEKQGKMDLAEAEFAKARQYNKNLKLDI